MTSKKKTLSTARCKQFIEDILKIQQTGDVEKAVEDATTSLIHDWVQLIEGSADTTFSYGTDGIITSGQDGSTKILVEAKKDQDFAGNKGHIAAVLTQVVHYLHTIVEHGESAPQAVVVADNNEIFSLSTKILEKYYTSDKYNWEASPSSAHKEDRELYSAIRSDGNIHPYVHAITKSFNVRAFLGALRAQITGSAPKPVHVSKDSLEKVFTNFAVSVLGGGNNGISNQNQIEIFVKSLKGDEETFIHPKKKNTLVLSGKEVKIPNSYSYQQFWEMYQQGGYTLDDMKTITEIADTLIKDVDRRMKGDFWTPKIWVDKAHDMISEQLGEDWYERYVVWDCAAGAKNLTRDYYFGNLYSSTYHSEELAISNDYNTNNVAFQYDFLNDDLGDERGEGENIHDYDVEALRKMSDDDLAGLFKMPVGLIRDMLEKKPIVFFANPPYGQATSAMGKKHKPGVSATAVTDLMQDMGHAKSELYTQFIWRTKELAKVFGYTSDFHFFFFNKTFLTSPNFGKFVDELTSEFTFRNGFMMNAGEFSGTSSAWGIVFSHFEIGGTNQREFTYTVLESNKDMSISALTEWTGRAVKNKDTIMTWLKEVPIGKENTDFPVARNGYDAPNGKVHMNPKEGCVGYMLVNGANVQGSDNHTAMFTMGVQRGHGRDVTKDNLTRAAVTFSIRRAVQEVIAEQKLLWVRDKDIFTRPPESLLTDEFVADCMVYSLFDRQSNQTSLRNYEYQGRTYRVVNEFFPWSRESIRKLAQDNHAYEIEKDIAAEPQKERILYTWIQDHRDDISAEAQAVLDAAWDIVVDSFQYREEFAEDYPRYQTASWDAGWTQISRMVFGKDRIVNDFVNTPETEDADQDESTALSRRDDFKKKLTVLGNKIAQAAYEDGVI